MRHGIYDDDYERYEKIVAEKMRNGEMRLDTARRSSASAPKPDQPAPSLDAMDPLTPRAPRG